MLRLEVRPVLVPAPTPPEFASVTTQVSVRLVRVLSTVGSSLLELKVTDCRAVSYWASVAVPVSVSTWLVGLKLPLMPF